jgi:hypothetical protein
MIQEIRCDNCIATKPKALIDAGQFSPDLANLHFEVMVQNGILQVTDTLGAIPIRLNLAGWMVNINKELAENKRDYVLSCPDCHSQETYAVYYGELH